MNTAEVQIDWMPTSSQSNGGDKSTLDYQKPFAIRIPDLSILNSSLGTHFAPGYIVASFK
jgi:hypothetical protein